MIREFFRFDGEPSKERPNSKDGLEPRADSSQESKEQFVSDETIIEVIDYVKELIDKQEIGLDRLGSQRLLQDLNKAKEDLATKGKINPNTEAVIRRYYRMKYENES